MNIPVDLSGENTDVLDNPKIDRCFHKNKHANRLLKTKALWIYVVVLLKCTENKL